MVPEDTVPTNVYMSSYLRHRTVQYGDQSFIGFIHRVTTPENSCALTTSSVACRFGSDELYIVSAINASTQPSVFVVK